MNIINKTLLNFNILHSDLIVRAVYIDGSKPTYDENTLLPNFGNHNVEVHDLFDAETRLVRFHHAQQTHSALNPQTFWSFLKKQFKGEASPKNSVAYFKLNDLEFDQNLVYRSAHGSETTLKIQPLPWNVFSITELEKHEIQPKILKLELFPKKQKFHVHLAYPLPRNEQGAVVTINYASSNNI